jgi:hypothetical protein
LAGTRPSGATEHVTRVAGVGLPLLVTDGSASYVYGPSGQILGQIAGSTRTYRHSDQLGSVRALTDQSGAVVATYAYDAYGQPAGRLPPMRASTSRGAVCYARRAARPGIRGSAPGPHVRLAKEPACRHSPGPPG